MPRHPATWRHIGREDGRVVVKGEGKAPGRGVWVAAEWISQDTSVERIANHGVVVKTLTCCCGQHRHNVLVLAASYL